MERRTAIKLLQQAVLVVAVRGQVLAELIREHLALQVKVMLEAMPIVLVIINQVEAVVEQVQLGYPHPQEQTRV
jgi:hypothetical protein